jgi:hypothetical protein
VFPIAEHDELLVFDVRLSRRAVPRPGALPRPAPAAPYRLR